MGGTATRVVASMTATWFLCEIVTYALLPSGMKAMAAGSSPTGIVRRTVHVIVLTTSTESERWLATQTSGAPGRGATLTGSIPTGTSWRRAIVAASKTARRLSAVFTA